jgi:transposase-like protein
LRKRRPKPCTTWHLDEVYLKIDGRMVDLWRAVDAEGEVLDVLVQSKRNKHAAMKLMRKLLKKYAFVPDRVVTDDLGLTARRPAISGLKAVMSAGEEQSGREFASTNSTTGAQDATFQERRFSPKILFNSCRRLQHLQRPTPSDFGPNAPPVSRCCHEHVAGRGRSGLIILEAPTLRFRRAAT